MRHRSFQVHIALWASAVSGIVLILFGIATWLIMRDQFLQSVDWRLADPLKRLGRSVTSNVRWNRYDGDKVGSSQHAAILPAQVFAVQSHAGEPLFRSALVYSLPLETFWTYLPTKDDIEALRSIAIAGDPFREFSDQRVFVSPDSDFLVSEEGEGASPFQIRPTRHLRSFTVYDEAGAAWRVVVVAGLNSTIFGGARLSDFDQQLVVMRTYLLSLIAIAFIFIAVAGRLIARRALAPLARISATASQVGAGELSQKIAVEDHDYAEFSQLAEALNGMMERLETSFYQATRFTADASHELKTPIAIMQAEINAALKKCSHESEERGVLSNLSEELQRLKRIIQSLLLLSQADSGDMQLSRTDVDLSAECQALEEDLDLLCESENLTVNCAIETGIIVSVDKVLFMQAIQNLISNAVKYNFKSGRIVFRLFKEKSHVCIRVSNTGNPIPTEERANIFKRFYRVDSARSRVTDGFGLGLNLAQEIVRSHEGSLTLCEYDEEGLTTFEVRI
ncbi:MAG: ATP-binding protein [Opitutaceae bacterium]